MLVMIKEIGIFVVVAQAILYFVPQEAYAKYVKVLIGLMIIAKIVFPIFSLLSPELWEEISFQGRILEGEILSQQELIEGVDGYDKLKMYYSEMAQEQNSRLQEENGDE